ETNRYLYRIIAYKYLLENAEELGFHVEDNEKYQPIPYRTLTVASSIGNLAQFAKQNGTTYKMLLKMNPWLKGKSLTVKAGKNYTLKFPAQ
ncbi:MAG: lytic transglycosylase domain-containing protein, partial [Chitinophagaceae bacterium]|nr:lytic transglycosylase domain-containing protein [Chitinophagaceae bacterium]